MARTSSIPESAHRSGRAAVLPAHPLRSVVADHRPRVAGERDPRGRRAVRDGLAHRVRGQGSARRDPRVEARALSVRPAGAPPRGRAPCEIAMRVPTTPRRRHRGATSTCRFIICRSPLTRAARKRRSSRSWSTTRASSCSCSRATCRSVARVSRVTRRASSTSITRPVRVRRRESVSQGLRARSQADRRDQPLRDRGSDQGPIIDQATIACWHRDSVDDPCARAAISRSACSRRRCAGTSRIASSCTPARPSCSTERRAGYSAASAVISAASAPISSMP